MAREVRLAVLAAEDLVRVEVGVVNETHAGHQACDRDRSDSTRLGRCVEVGSTMLSVRLFTRW